MSKPLVSICIPAYENPDGIVRLLSSVREQTYPAYEVIITDDSASSRVGDAVRSFCDALTEKDTPLAQLSYTHNQNPQGSTANWNHAISRAQGDYIKIMHHDDCFTMPESLAAFVKLMEDHPDADLGFSGSRQFNLSDDTFYDRCISEEDVRFLREDPQYVATKNGIGAPSAVICRAKTLRQNHIIYDPELVFLVDVGYYLSVFSRNPQFCYTTEPLITIGVSDAQLTAKVGDDTDLLLRELDRLRQTGLISETLCQTLQKKVRLERRTRNRETLKYLINKHLLHRLP